MCEKQIRNSLRAEIEFQDFKFKRIMTFILFNEYLFEEGLGKSKGEKIT